MCKKKQTHTWHCFGPHDTAISSPATLLSFILTASSTAISSKGFMLCFTPSVTTPDLSGFTLTYQPTTRKKHLVIHLHSTFNNQN